MDVKEIIDNREILKKEIIKALKEKRYYNPHNVFHHEPEFYKSTDERYLWEVWIIKWNTKSTRITKLNARFDEKKQNYIFSKKKGQKRTPHGEKMR